MVERGRKTLERKQRTTLGGSNERIRNVNVVTENVQRRTQAVVRVAGKHRCGRPKGSGRKTKRNVQPFEWKENGLTKTGGRHYV